MDKSYKLHTFFICIFLVLGALFVYMQVRQHDFIDFDDPQYIVDNSHVASGLTRENIIWAFTKAHSYNWHPLTWMSHMIDCELYGLNAGGHHITNVLFHIVNTLLLFFVLKRMTGGVWPSAFVAAMFALHPAHVESVAWVSERKDVLSSLFWILTMWAYTRYVERSGIKRYLLVLLFFAVGLTAKQMLVTLPFVLLLLDYWPLGRLKLGTVSTYNASDKVKVVSVRRCIVEKIPMFVLSVIASVTVYLVQDFTGVVKTTSEYPVIYRIENAFVSYVMYMWKMVLPVKLSIFYPHPIESLAVWKVLSAVFLLILITVVVVINFRRWPYMAVGWFWYTGTLIPVIGFVQVGLQSMADRYTYMPFVGLFIVIGWGMSEFSVCLPKRRAVFSTLAGLLFLVLGFLSWRQVGYWRNDIALYSHAAKVVSGNWWAHFRLGLAYDKLKDVNSAIFHYEKTLQFKHDYPIAIKNLGYAYVCRGDLQGAIEQYNKALQYRPDFAEVYVMYGDLLLGQSRFDEATVYLNKAIELEPRLAVAYKCLGFACVQEDKLQKAIAYYTTALKLSPNDADTCDNLAKIYYKVGDIDNAISYWSKALQLKPDCVSVRDNLSKLIQWKEKNGGIVSAYLEKLKGDPNNPDIYDQIAKMFYREHEFESAVEYWSQAVKLRSDWTAVLNNLAWLLATKSDALFYNPQRAIEYAERACKLTDYNNIEMLDTLGVSYGAAGRFDEAMRTAEKALRLATESKEEQLAGEIQKHLELYRAGRPYREE